MFMTKDEALKMAIEALENIHNRLIATDRRGLRYDEAEALDACKEALEAEQVCQEDSRVRQNDVPAQEPVTLTEAVAIVLEGFNIPSDVRKILETAYYTHPHQWQGNKEFVGLTDDEIIDMYFQANISPQPAEDVINFIRAIEQELKTKNGFSDVKGKNT
jgi:hypothetical protein